MFSTEGSLNEGLECPFEFLVCVSYYLIAKFVGEKKKGNENKDKLDTIPSSH